MISKLYTLLIGLPKTFNHIVEAPGSIHVLALIFKIHSIHSIHSILRQQGEQKDG